MDAYAHEVAAPPSARWLIAEIERLVPAMQARAEAHDRDATFPLEDLDDLRTAGALAAPLPEALGGLGLGTTPQGAAALGRVLRLVGAGNLALGRVYEGHVNALRLINLYGTDAQARTAAADARDGALFGVWNTPVPVAPLTIQSGMLHGAKTLCSGAGVVTRALVTADNADGTRQMVLASLRAGERADVSGWTAQGMRGSLTGRMALDGVPAAALIGGPDDYVRQPEFSAGAWRVLAVLCGGAESLADAMRAHLVERGRDGDPFQRARAGEVFAAVETAKLFVARAGALAEAGAAESAAYVDLARGAVEAACVAVIRLVQRSVGLAALMAPAPAERIARDLATYLRQPAPDAALAAAGTYFLRHDLPEPA